MIGARALGEQQSAPWLDPFHNMETSATAF